MQWFPQVSKHKFANLQGFRYEKHSDVDLGVFCSDHDRVLFGIHRDVDDLIGLFIVERYRDPYNRFLGKNVICCFLEDVNRIVDGIEEARVELSQAKHIMVILLGA